MIGTLFGKAVQFDQICLNRKDFASGATGPEFTIHDFEHGTAEIDGNHVIASFGQWQCRSSAPTSQVEDDLGTGLFWAGECLLQDLLIQPAERSFCHKIVVMVGYRPLLDIFPRPGGDASRPPPLWN